MNESALPLAVGVDLGTNDIKIVIGEIRNNDISVIGFAKQPSNGIEKGIIVASKLPITISETEKTLNQAEQLSGIRTSHAAFSVNGSYLKSTYVSGTTIINGSQPIITAEQIERVKHAATTGRVSPNHQILDLSAINYTIDGQPGFTNPLNMSGTRLELEANAITVIKPQCTDIVNLAKSLELEISSIEPSVIAASEAILTESQKSNGVAIVDFGSDTTSIAVYIDGKFEHLYVLDIGSNSITKDLATSFTIPMDLAEEIKKTHGLKNPDLETKENLNIKYNGKVYTFPKTAIYNCIEARTNEIFKDLDGSLYSSKLRNRTPEGIVLTGGGAKLKGLSDYITNNFNISTRIGKPLTNIGLVTEVKGSEYAAALGLMLVDAQSAHHPTSEENIQNKKSSNFLKNFFQKLFN